MAPEDVEITTKTTAAAATTTTTQEKYSNFLITKGGKIKNKNSGDGGNNSSSNTTNTNAISSYNNRILFQLSFHPFLRRMLNGMAEIAIQIIQFVCMASQYCNTIITHENRFSIHFSIVNIDSSHYHT